MKPFSGTHQYQWITIKPELRDRLVFTAWIAFGVVLLAVYYRQVWALFALGPTAWVRNNFSLLSAARLITHLDEGQSSYFPAAWREALARNAAALLGAGLVLIAGLGLGVLILRLARIRPASKVDRFVFQIALGLGVLAYLSLGLAAIGLYRQEILVSLVVLCAFGTLIWLMLVRFGQRVYRHSRNGGRPFSIYLKGQAVWIVPFSAACLIALLRALAPEIEYDSLWYHLWLPMKWMESGRMVDIVSEYVSLYPLTWELVYGAAMVTGGPVAAKLVHWACLPLTALLVFQFTRRFFPQASPWLAAALLATAPTVLWEATTAYNDLSLAFFSTLALYACLNFLESRRRSWLVLGGLALGLALATKHLAFLVLLPACLGLAILLWAEERSLRHALGPVLLFAGIALLIPLPWYLRSFAASGNPFFPDLYPIFGAHPPERWSEVTERGLTHFKGHFGDPRTPLNLVLLPWNVTVHAARYGGSLGPVFTLLLPGLLLTGQGSRPTRLLLAFCAAYLALWASPISSFQLRFLLPISPLLSVLGAEACGRLARILSELNLRPGLPKAILAGLLLLNLPPFLSLHEADRAGYLGWLTHVVHTVPLGVTLGFETQESYLSREVPSYQAWKYINQHLAREARVLTFSGGDHLYSERERIWSDATVAHPAVWGAQRGDEEQALATLRQLGITHLLIDRRQAANLQTGAVAILEPEVLLENFRLEYEDERFLLFGFR